MKPNRVLITGGGGLIGTRLIELLEQQGCSVFRAVRSKPTKSNEIHWEPSMRSTDLNQWEGFDAIINLNGASIAQRWTAAVKKDLLESRTAPTSFISEIISSLESPPKVFISASATGFYPLNGGPFDESSPSGESFIASICRHWESAIRVPPSVRVCVMRIGQVLDPRGGMLAKLLPVFRLGLGGSVGSGRQMVNWIAIDDLTAAFWHLLCSDDSSGAYNAVSPGALNFHDFAKALASALRRPCLFPVPGFMLKLIFGEMAEELLLSGPHVLPKKLLDENFSFLHKDLLVCLRSFFHR